jgi:AcrR family transcriptional regulator
MSGNDNARRVHPPQSKRKTDRRVQRTRDRLGDALIGLMQEKQFDSITVQEVLDRASVGRSTFYAHYRDKLDLFLSDLDEFLEAMATALSRGNDTSERVAPVRELFAHVAQERRLYNALVESGRMHDFLELAQGHFARGIERRLTELSRSLAVAPAQRAALAHALAGSLLSLLTWWMALDAPAPPEEMDEVYHRLVWSGVNAPADREP